MSDPNTLFENLLQLKHGQQRPPVHLWQPERVGEIDIEIDSNGVWYHEGRPFKRQALVNVFATILRKEDSRYYLVTPAEKLRISVADVPFMAVDMEVRHSGAQTDLLFTTNVEDYVLADAEHPLSMHGGRPYLLVRAGLQAKLTRSVYYRLVETGCEEDGVLAVYSQGARFELGATG